MKLDLAKFDLNLLVAFETLMTERGVTRAGRAMGITQAAMSNTLRRLRDIFDDPLFVKSGNRMEPTPRALELAGPVSRALEHVRHALDQTRFDPAHANHLFRIAAVDYALATMLPQLLDKLARHAPRIRLELVDPGGAEQAEAMVLENGVVDLVVSRFQWVPNNIHLHRFYDIHYVCVCRRDHPLAPNGRLTLDSFLAARHIHFYPDGMTTTVVDEALAQMGRERQIVCRTFSLSLIPTILQQSDMMTVMPSGAAHAIVPGSGLQILELPVQTPHLRMAMAWHARTEHSPANIWLRQQVMEIFAENRPPG